jgi:hypothetical protein
MILVRLLVWGSMKDFYYPDVYWTDRNLDARGIAKDMHVL